MKAVFKKLVNADFFSKISKFFKEYFYILLLILPFVVIDLSTRIFSTSIGFLEFFHPVPIIFNIIWIGLFIGIVLSFKTKVSKILYLIFSILSIVIYLVNNIYYSMTNNFFDFTLVESVGEGSSYLLDAIIGCNIWVYIVLVLIISLVIVGYRFLPKKENNLKLLPVVFLIFTVIHIINPLFLGNANEDLVWSTWKNPRNVYNSFNDNNKSMRVSGIYEYTFRNFYVTYIRNEEVSEEELAYLEEVYAVDKKINNKYTGKLKDKNLIFVQLEGIDSWLLTKEDTPTLYNMRSNAINFTNHYSFYNGGGSTFNSEFAVNTGFIVPFSYNKNAYSFNKNDFPYSMAKLFKNLGYSVNAFHMNSKEYYSRGINYANWGYDNYYGLIDMFDYSDYSYQLDRELILNEEFSELMFPVDQKFVNYLITYSTHLPFSNAKGVCKQLLDLDALEGLTVKDQMTEEECARRQAKETDYMMRLLVDKLKEKKLLDDTVFVVFSDHYLYTLEDKTILDKYKTTSNNLINKTPFFIWSGGDLKTTVKKVSSQLDILPTVLNLFGIDFNATNYIGTDILDNSHSNVVYFSDYSWYDGTLYVENGEVTNKKKIKDKAKFDKKNQYVSAMTKKNDLTLKYNYFKQLKTKEQ